ncbi:hypothetical protein [Paenibacillus polymyxa]|uniref:hypothetical protein n=1 Tax=Paenibacillus polymyxa TaxID=1406 RepID=UPI0032AFE265
MGIVLGLEAVMYHSGIRKQKDLIKRLEAINISAEPIVINHIFHNTIKQLPVHMIYGICAVTNSSPGDWIKFVDKNGIEWIDKNSPLDNTALQTSGIKFLLNRKGSVKQFTQSLDAHQIKISSYTLRAAELHTLKRLPLEFVHGVCIITGMSPGDWIRAVDSNGNEIKAKGIRLDGTIVRKPELND